MGQVQANNLASSNGYNYPQILRYFYGNDIEGLGSDGTIYDPPAAVNYAEVWWDDRNPNYHDYSSSGGDCANFVSQCLIAGGLELSVCDSCTWIDDKGCLPRCSDLHTYLVDYLHATWETKPRGQLEPLWFVPGDPAIFGYSDTHPRTHAVFAVTGDATHSATCNAHSPNDHHVSIENFYNIYPSLDRCTFYHIPVSTPNDPPNKPSIPSGPPSGQIGISYTYSTVTTDPNGDTVYYWFDWGDDTNSGWIGPYSSGTSGSASKEWSNPGTYNVKTKAKDEHGAESSPLWSDSLPVCINGLWADDPSNLCKKRKLTCTGEYEYQNKDDGTICGCTAGNTLKSCYSGVCTDTGICNSNCGADVACDGKEPGDSCGGGTCDSNCKCGGQAVGEGYGVFSAPIWFVDKNGDHLADDVFGYGFAGATPLVGDFNQDGSDDIAVVYLPWWFVDTNGDQIADETFSYGFAGGTPLVGDFNQDGKDDIAVVSLPTWFVDTDRDQVADDVFGYGFAGATPMVGDFNQDGSDDIAVVYLPWWFVDTDRNQVADDTFGYGFADATPMVGDFNQDGSDDIAVVDLPIWFVDTDMNQVADDTFGYGFAGATPIVGNFG
jgi:hypothetical protein